MKLADERPADELIDADLTKVFARQWRVSQMALELAETLYCARRVWLGDGGPAWKVLSVDKKREARREIEQLIKQETR